MAQRNQKNQQFAMSDLAGRRFGHLTVVGPTDKRANKRICKIKLDGYYMVGDAQTVIEGPIQREQIFGLITGVTRKGKQLAPGDFWWEFFEKVWPKVIPFRTVLTRLYAYAKHLGRK